LLIGIIHKEHDNGYSKRMAKQVIKFFEDNCPDTRQAEIFEGGKDYHMVITIGGDGTVLRANSMVPMSVPLMCINSGTIGYLTDIPKEHMAIGLKNFIKERWHMETYESIEASIGDEMMPPAINEVLIKLETPTNMIKVDIAIDGEYIDTVQADAFMVATPLGSTAYNYSAGGSVLHPKTQCFILTAVAPYKPFTPMVVPSDSVIKLSPKKTYTEKIIISDGMVMSQRIMGDTKSVYISKSEQKRDFVKVFAHGYFDKIRARRA